LYHKLNRMKNFIYTLFLVCIFSICSLQSFANHLIGGEITYSCKSTPGTWQVTLILYSDCNVGNICFSGCGGACSKSVNISSPDLPSYSYFISLGLVSVSDVDANPLCPSSKSICTNTGCVTAGSYTPGLEKYIFQGTVDLSSSVLPSGICNLVFWYQECCRGGSITSSSYGENFYLEATMNLCASTSPCNSAPILSNDPVVEICGGQTFLYNMGAIDPDHDSLSYSFTPALSGQNYPMNYTSPYTYDAPMPYSPTKNGPLPLGIHCDPVTGDIGFTPSYGVSGSFIGTVAVQIKQWKKVAGTYTLMGTTMRECIMYLSSCAPNHPPIIVTNPSVASQTKLNWKVSADNTLCFNVIAKDTDYIPYNTPIISDSTYLSWNNALSSYGATFTPTYNTANRTVNGPREDSYQFCWTPDSTMVSNIPWMFTVRAIDSRCPLAAKITRSFLITVVGSPSAKIMKDTTSCYKWNLSYLSPHPEYITSQKWQVSNTSGAFNNSDFSTFNSSTVNSFLFSDTGKYVVKLILHGDVSTGAITEIYDTVYNTSSFRLAPLPDTTLCPGSVNFMKLKANHSGGKLPLTTIWFDPIKNTILSYNDSVLVPLNVTKNYVFYVTDSSNCTLSDYSTVTVRNWPVNSPSINPTICEGSSYTFDAGDNNGNIKSYQWNTDDSTQTINANVQQNYSVRIIDTLGCYNYNSFYLFINRIPKINAGNDTTICKGKSIQLQASGANLYQWNLLTDSTIISNTNILTVLPDSSTFYRVIGIDTMNNVSCYKADTIKVILNPKPAIPSISGPSTVPHNMANIYSAANHSGNLYNWFLSTGNISSGQGTNAVNAIFTSIGSNQINVSESQNNCWSDTASKSLTVNAVGGINEKYSFENLNVYPNPTSGILNIEFETSDKIIVLEVFDILGKSVLKSSLQHTGGLFQHALNIAEMNKGIYFLKTFAEGKTMTIKVTFK
jgi:Secretion system C-terminal sorting domain